MQKTIRNDITGETLFFTVSLADSRRTLLVDHVEILRSAVRDVRYDHPFEIVAWVVLPNHMHAIWQMPVGDRAYGQRWGDIKSRFTRAMRRANVISRPEIRHAKETLGHAGVWQPRFREHAIHSADERQFYAEYCWNDPVKHGLVQDACEWPFSSVHRDQRDRMRRAA